MSRLALKISNGAAALLAVAALLLAFTDAAVAAPTDVRPFLPPKARKNVVVEAEKLKAVQSRNHGRRGVAMEVITPVGRRGTMDSHKKFFAANRRGVLEETPLYKVH